MKQIAYYSWSIKWQGEYRRSPLYTTVEEAHKNLLPFMQQFAKNCGHMMPCTFCIEYRYVQEKTEKGA